MRVPYSADTPTVRSPTHQCTRARSEINTYHGAVSSVPYVTKTKSDTLASYGGQDQGRDRSEWLDTIVFSDITRGIKMAD